MNYTCPTCGSKTERKHSSSSGLGVKQIEILKYLTDNEPKSIANISRELEQTNVVVRDRVKRLLARGLVAREELDFCRSKTSRHTTYVYTSTNEGIEASKIKRVKSSRKGMGLGKKQKEVISYLSREGTMSINNIAADLAYAKSTMNARMNRLVDKELVLKYSVGISNGRYPTTQVYKLSKRGGAVAKKIRAERVLKIRGHL
jgi:DNA-binding MarR family transcriptional regulator